MKPCILNQNLNLKLKLKFKFKFKIQISNLELKTASNMAQVTPSMAAASTSMAQASNTVSQHEFLFSTPTSHIEEPETSRFMQQKVHRQFPHAAIPYNHSSESPTPVVSTPNSGRGQLFEEGGEGEGEVNHSQPWSALYEHMLPRAASYTVPPLLANSHQLPYGAANQAHQFMAQHNTSSPRIPIMHGIPLLSAH